MFQDPRLTAKRSLICLLTLFASWLSLREAIANASPGPITATLNGLAITIDADSGSILRLRYAGITMLESKPDRATMLEIGRLISNLAHAALKHGLPSS